MYVATSLMEARVGDITQLLGQLETGDSPPINRLLPLVYEELRHLVRHQRHGPAAQGPATTSVVHEAYLKLAAQTQVEWRSRAQFFYLAAQVIRSILIDNARRARRLKHGGDQRRVELDPDLLSSTHDEELLQLDAALERLRAHDARAHAVVVCRFFGGMEIDETAEALECSAATVKRDWVLARTWLYRELLAHG